MESYMLDNLEWNVFFITPFRWVRHYLKQLPLKWAKDGSLKETMCEVSLVICFMWSRIHLLMTLMQMMALLDLAVLDYDVLRYQPSELASAALMHVVAPSPKLLKQVPML